MDDEPPPPTFISFMTTKLLTLGTNFEGAFAAKQTDTYTVCEQLRSHGLMARTRLVEDIQQYHTTQAGIRHLGHGIH